MNVELEIFPNVNNDLRGSHVVAISSNIIDIRSFFSNERFELMLNGHLNDQVISTYLFLPAAHWSSRGVIQHLWYCLTSGPGAFDNSDKDVGTTYLRLSTPSQCSYWNSNTTIIILGSHNVMGIRKQSCSLHNCWSGRGGDRCWCDLLFQ